MREEYNKCSLRHWQRNIFPELYCCCITCINVILTFFHQWCSQMQRPHNGGGPRISFPGGGARGRSAGGKFGSRSREFVRKFRPALRVKLGKYCNATDQQGSRLHLWWMSLFAQCALKAVQPTVQHSGCAAQWPLYCHWIILSTVMSHRGFIALSEGLFRNHMATAGTGI